MELMLTEVALGVPKGEAGSIRNAEDAALWDQVAAEAAAVPPGRGWSTPAPVTRTLRGLYPQGVERLGPVLTHFIRPVHRGSPKCTSIRISI
jgi:hypothetical protein